MLPLTSFAIVSSIFSDTRPQQWHGAKPPSGADKSIPIKNNRCARPLLTLRSRSKGFGNKCRVKLVGLQETYAPAATTFLLTSMIRVCSPTPQAL